MPFTVNQFLDVFAAYNAAIWPAQIGAYAFAVVILVALFSRRPSAVRGAMAALAVLWAFIGIGYHLMFFATINPAAPVFVGFFVLQAVLFAVNAVGPGNLRFHLGRDVRTWAGLVATVYALAIYPVVGA